MLLYVHPIKIIEKRRNHNTKKEHEEKKEKNEKKRRYQILCIVIVVSIIVTVTGAVTVFDIRAVFCFYRKNRKKSSNRYLSERPTTTAWRRHG